MSRADAVEQSDRSRVGFTGFVYSQCQEAAQTGELLMSVYGMQGQSVTFALNSIYPFSCNPA